MQRFSRPILFAVIVGVVVALSSTAWAGETVGRATSVSKPALTEAKATPSTASGYLQKVIFTVRSQMLRWLGVPIVPMPVKEPLIDTPKTDSGPQSGSTAPTNAHPKFDIGVFYDNGGELIG